MFGLASISEFPKRVDLFDKADWQRALSSATLATLASARDPLQTGLIGFPFSPAGMWAFEAKKSAIRIIAGDLGSSLQGLRNKTDRARARLEPFATLAPFLLKNSKLKPSIEQLCDLVQNVQHTSEYSPVNYTEFLKKVGQEYVLEWIEVNDIDIAMLVERNKVRTENKNGHPFQTKC